jgi:hypothetical protein
MKTIEHEVSLSLTRGCTHLLTLHQIRGGRPEGFHRDTLANIQG